MNDKLLLQVLKWKEQAQEDSVKWLRVHGPHEKPILDAYAAGFAQGFMQAYHLLNLHGKIKEVQS